MRDILFLLAHFEEIHSIVRWTRDKDAAKERLMSELYMSESLAVFIVDSEIDDFTNEDLELVKSDLERLRRIIFRFFPHMLKTAEQQ